jgi:hypothetical protein
MEPAVVCAMAAGAMRRKIATKAAMFTVRVAMRNEKLRKVTKMTVRD